MATGGIERKSKQIFTDCDPKNKQCKNRKLKKLEMAFSFVISQNQIYLFFISLQQKFDVRKIDGNFLW